MSEVTRMAYGFLRAMVLGGPAYAATDRANLILYCDGWLDAAAILYCNAAAGLAQTQTIVVADAVRHDLSLSKDRIVYVAFGRRNEEWAQRWGADAYRAGAREVRRVVPPDGAKNWSEALFRVFAARALPPP